MNKKQNNFQKRGFLKLEKQIDLDVINLIKLDLKKKNIGTLYKDNKGNPRRIENIYNKSVNLNTLNRIITKLIEKIFKKKLVIFKDKCNLKPPGGGGFAPHYDGIFYFKDKKNNFKKGWYEYSDYFLNVLVALDKCTKKNGSIEISKWNDQKFENLYENTKKNGSPELNKKVAKNIV